MEIQDPGTTHDQTLTPAPAQAPEDLLAPLKFLTWQPLYETEKPFQVFANLPAGAADPRTTNLVFGDRIVRIRDVRAAADDQGDPGNQGNQQKQKCGGSLDERGFVYRKHRTRVPVDAFRDRAVVEASYLPEMEELLRAELGEESVDRVFFFDWRLRKNAPEVEGEVIDMNDLTTWLRPAMHVHIDQSPAAVLRRIQLQLPDEADFLLQGRVRVINIWRPLIPQVLDYPLTLCSGSRTSIPHPETQLVECDHIRRHYMGSTLYLRHCDDLQDSDEDWNENQEEKEKRQEFWYMSRQGIDDVVIFKNFDSEEGVGASFAPHASFRHPNLKEGEEGGDGNVQRRESIEVRALVFTYAKGGEEDQNQRPPSKQDI